MAVEIRVPQMGESVVEATVGKWLKSEGDRVSAGEQVVELETDKVNVEVAADVAGVLERIERQTGETVQTGDVLAVVAEKTDGAQPAARPAETARPAPETGTPSRAPAGGPPPGEATSPAAPGETESRDVTPIARRMAEEMGIDIAQVPGTGPGGRTTKEDVLTYAQQQPSPASAATTVAPAAAAPAPSPAPAPAAAPRPAQAPARPPTPGPDRREERVRMTRRRQTIARRLVEAQQTAAMLTTFNEVDMTAVMELRKRRREAFKKRHDVDLGYMSFFTKASIGALKAFPEVNAEIQGDEIVYHRYYDIGVAIGAEGGLVVPVLRDADRMSFADIERAIGVFVEKVRDGTLTLDDLRGGTFTITNGGVFGSLMSTPILNPPQVGILGMHKIEERPIAKDGQVVIHPMMYLALSYDHRIVDGREAVQFLVRIKELLEDPETLLLEG